MAEMRSSWASSEATRRSMQANRPRDTKPEWAVRSAVHRRGLRYRVNARPLPNLRRTADLVFRSVRVAVFVDGCFWHGCRRHHTKAATNATFWERKVEDTRRRDRETNRHLRLAGWEVLRFWEHEDPNVIADEVESVVARRRRVLRQTASTAGNSSRSKRRR